MFVLALAALALTTSCGLKTASAGAAAKQYTEYLAAGEYGKFVDGIYFGEEATAEEVAEYRTGLQSMAEEKAKPELEKKGGLTDVEILSETLAEDGKSAEVTLKRTYGNGETEEETNTMVLVDGRWMMKMEK